MSRKFGELILRYKFAIVAVWVITAIWMVTQAPSLKDVAVSETSEFLPSTAPSIVAQTALAKAFPTEGNMGSAIIVFARPGGLTDADNAYASLFLEWLASPEGPSVTRDVTSLFNRPGTESLFLSPDRSTMLAQVGFSSGPMEESTQQAIQDMRQKIAQTTPPQGMSAHVTGTSAISSDQRAALFEGVDRTTLVTILLVVFVLLLIYRSPVAAMAPLLTISLAWMVARGVLGYLAVVGWKVSSFVDTFIIVLIFGVGTDYCLFILSRFREELGRQGTRDEAIVVTMSAIGAVITASAATVIVALVFMAAGEFIMLQTMGPAMALAVFITLLAGLTLTPALVAIVGHYLFWPRHDEVAHDGGKIWQRIAELATTRYAQVALVVVAALLVPYLALPQMIRMFDVLAELPDKTDSVQGFDKLAQGFDSGELLPVTVLLTAPQGNVLDDLAKIDQFTAALEAAPQVQRVRSVLQPTGDEKTATMFLVDTQLKQVDAGLDPLIKGLDDPAGLMKQPSGSQQGGSMADLSAFLGDLGRLPVVAANPAHREAVTRTQAVDAGLARLTEAGKLVTQLDGLSQQMAQLAQALASTAATTASAGAATNSASDLKTLTSYLTQMGQAFPALAKESSYQNALGDLKSLGDDLSKAQDALLVANQLGLLAQQIQELSKALSSPFSALALTGTSQQLPLLAGYYADLGKAFPAIAGTPAYQSVASRLLKLETAGKQMLTNPPTNLTAALADLQKDVDGLAADTIALRQVFVSQAPQAQFVPQNLQALISTQGNAAALPDPAKPAQRLADNMAALTAVARAQLPAATFMPKDIPLNEEMKRALASLKQDALGLQAALNRLAADTAAPPIHFLPRAMLTDARTASLLSYFLSADGKSTRLTVVLKARPYSPQANEDVQALEKVVAKAGQTVGLQTVTGGAPVIMNDVQQVMNRDFIKIAIFTIVGVFIVLILLLRSLVAPIYLVLTVLLSYGTTLGISTIVFQDILGQEGVNYIIPIIVFVLLVALGADYNIFLMSRVREEAAGRGTRQGIRVASAFTGSIITSCGVILAGTFAAMMVAPIQTLFQVGFAVAAGVLVDTFIIRAVLVPAIAAALGERNWWPGKIKTQ